METIIVLIINSFFQLIPPDVAPFALIGLLALFIASETLPFMKRFKGNGLVHAIVVGLIKKNKGESLLNDVTGIIPNQQIAEKTFQAIKQQEPVSVSDETSDDPTGVSPKR